MATVPPKMEFIEEERRQAREDFMTAAPSPGGCAGCTEMCIGWGLVSMMICCIIPCSVGAACVTCRCGEIGEICNQPIV